MMRRITHAIVLFSGTALVGACGGIPESNEINFDSNGQGTFSGTAGSDWSPVEIQNIAANDICAGSPVQDFTIRVLPSVPDVKLFSGRCASGHGAGVATTNTLLTGARPVAPVTAPGTTSAASFSAGWDGSTPYID